MSISNAAVPKIRIEHLIHIYGDHPRTALQLFREGQSRAAILQETGNVVGVADVSLTIGRGELFVIMGLSGSGKSTLVRCLNRLVQPISGHIYIDQEDVVHCDPPRIRQLRTRQVSMVFQRFGLFPHKTVLENVAYGLKIQGQKRAQRRQQALEMLDRVGLADRAQSLPATLSGGMQQRVGLARALATGADILLMDEPFSALDPLIRRDMQEELLRLQRELHKTIVFISHDIHEALKLGDRIAVMKEGRIVQIGNPTELLTQPADDYIRAFTQDVNGAQVLTAAMVAQSTACLPSSTPVNKALDHLRHHHLRHLTVVDDQGKPMGWVNQQHLDQAVADGHEDLSKVLETEFLPIQAATPIEETFHLYDQRKPVIVVKEDGTVLGCLDPVEVLTQLQR